MLVVAGEVAGAMERVTDSWRANIARGARPRAVALGETRARASRSPRPAALEADVAGVDLLVAPDGEMLVLEVNGIPGWQALQSVCEEDLTARVIGEACEAAGHGVMRPSCRAVATSAPAAPAASSARRSSSSRTPPPA